MTEQKKEVALTDEQVMLIQKHANNYITVMNKSIGGMWSHVALEIAHRIVVNAFYDKPEEALNKYFKDSKAGVKKAIPLYIEQRKGESSGKTTVAS